MCIIPYMIVNCMQTIQNSIETESTNLKTLS